MKDKDYHLSLANKLLQVSLFYNVICPYKNDSAAKKIILIYVLSSSQQFKKCFLIDFTGHNRPSPNQIFCSQETSCGLLSWMCEYPSHLLVTEDEHCLNIKGQYSLRCDQEWFFDQSIQYSTIKIFQMVNLLPWSCTGDNALISAAKPLLSQTICGWWVWVNGVGSGKWVKVTGIVRVSGLSILYLRTRDIWNQAISTSWDSLYLTEEKTTTIRIHKDVTCNFQLPPKN